MRQPETRYAKVGGSSVASTVSGKGPIDLVGTMGPGGHVEHVYAVADGAQISAA
jgi:hypothetical protein